MRAEREIHVMLAGNPNVGKSTLFNNLTGLHQHTGNWPGKTVAVASGTCRKGEHFFRFTDLPGTYSLEGKSPDEEIAAQAIRQKKTDCIVAVCDGTCLERSLHLVLQLMRSTQPVIVCVNLMDEARKRGIHIDRKKLADLLGVPVVFTSACHKRGLNDLLDTIRQTAGRTQIHKKWEEPVQAAENIAAQCVLIGNPKGKLRREKIDRILAGRALGIPLMFALLLLVIWLTVWGANYPSMLLEQTLDLVYGVLQQWMAPMPGWIRGLLLDGIYVTCARVISVMLPPMAIFFPLFTLLEDMGYLPRVAFLLDRPMCRCGGCGKQALTLCMGLGCNAVGVMGCRILSSPRQKRIAVITNAMVPCNGRFPTLIILGSLFFPQAGAALVVAAGVVLGVAGAMGTSAVLSRTVLKTEPGSFAMEIPPFRRPRLGQILVRSVLDRTIFVAGRALLVAAPAGALFWALSQWQLLPGILNALDPIGRFLGMNGVILLAFLLALPANELVVPVMLMGFSGVSTLQQTAGLGTQVLLDGGLTWQMAVCTMVFTLFHWPCSTTLITAYKETGSLKDTLAAAAVPTAVGVSLCMLLQWIFQTFTA